MKNHWLQIQSELSFRSFPGTGPGRFKAAALFACAVLLLTLTACGGGNTAGQSADTSSAAKTANTADAAKTGTAESSSLNIGISAMPVNFNTLERSDDAILDLFFQPLLQYDDDGTFWPLLADSVTTEDNQTYTVKLNERAKWTDGEPVTADDVLFTVKSITNKNATAVMTSKFYVFEGTDDSGYSLSADGVVSGIAKVDDHTLTFRTKFPVNDNVVKSIFTVLRTLPEHVLKDVPIEQFPTQELFQKPTVTNGPYKLVAYQQDQYMQLSANPDYFNGAPKIGQLNFKILTAANITAQLESGEIDLNASSVPYDDYERVRTLAGVTTYVTRQPIRARILFINTQTVTDSRVRQAISYALDRDALVAGVLKGAGTPAQGPYLDNNVFYNAGLSAVVHDPEKAKSLLKEAGWDAGKTLRLVVGTRDQTAVRAAEIVANQLTEAGIGVKVEQYDHATALAKARAGEFDLVIFGYGLSPVEPDVSFLIKSTGSFNLGKYNNADVDHWLTEGLKIVDTEQRKAAYNKVQEIFGNDFPTPFLYGEKIIFAVNQRVNLGGEPKAFGFYNNVYQWDVR